NQEMNHETGDRAFFFDRSLRKRPVIRTARSSVWLSAGCRSGAAGFFADGGLLPARQHLLSIDAGGLPGGGWFLVRRGVGVPVCQVHGGRRVLPSRWHVQAFAAG